MATKDLKLGKARAIAGYVKPNHSDDQVAVTVKRGGDLVIRKTLALNSDSRYSWTYKPKKVGSYNFSVNYAGDDDHFGGASPTKGYKVVN
ncbi:MAG: hypothetical protein ACRDSJ_04005 [Rubrobacteraceae bacterium]